jgi:hypothetical protein
MRGAIATLAALIVLLGGAAAAGGSTPIHGSIAGVVPHTGLLQTAFAPLLPKLAGSPRSATFTFSGTYENLINQYFNDVALASVANAVDNVYSVDTQYFSNPGHVNIQYSSTFGGSYVSHDPLPANGCDDTFDTGSGIVSDPVCLTDQQLQNEIQHVLTQQGWHGSLSNMFFLMTPDGVGSCFDSTPASSDGECSTNAFCAYHNYFVNASNEDVIYANEPLEPSDSIGGCTNPPTQGFPNDPQADTTINTISHEHNEAITDPLTDDSDFAWIADDGLGGTPGDEIGDLCAYTFGAALGTFGGQPYNQLINGNHYSLQEEFSNAASTPAGKVGCVQKRGGAASSVFGGHGPLVYQGGPVMHTNTTYAIYWAPTPGDAVQPTVTGTVAVHHRLTSSAGTWNGGATGFSYQWQRCSSVGTGCANISGATAATYTLTSADGGNTVRSTVSATNVNGASRFTPSATTAVVAPVPAATGAPVVSGAAGVGKSLSTTSGTWNTSVSFTYQWLRCAADGSGCAAIPVATANTYPLVAADAGHRLKAVVSGTNAAGTTSASSAASAVIVAAPHVKTPPRISGRAKAGRLLKATLGTWSGPPRRYTFAWLRCSAHGSRCALITKATRATYRPKKQDAGHRLRLRVTAVNVAGQRTATSRPSKLVRR